MKETESYYMDKLVELELFNNLYEPQYKGFPIYRFFTYFIRPAWIFSKDNDYKVDNRNERPPFSITLKNCICSLCEISLLLLLNKKKKVAFFPSMRMQKDKDCLFDKFSDPVIIQSGMSNSEDIVIFSSSYYLDYRKRRANKKMICQAEFIYFASLLIAYILLPFFKLTKDRKKVDEVLFSVQNMFEQKIDFRKKSYIRFISFIIQFKFYLFLFQRIKCKKIFVVIKGNCYPQILAAHHLGIKVYEIQHGVTYGSTVLYAAPYNEYADPDYFLTFGEMWIGSQFGLPVDRLINIGFAYKDFLKEMKRIIVKKNSVLVISSPEITDPMVNITVLLAQHFDNYNFYFRPHPHEGLTNNQNELLGKQHNIYFSERTIDSNVEVLNYSKIIGTNSSVLYEAKSFGIDVGRLMFGNLSVDRYPGDEGFFYIKSLHDFERFLNEESTGSVKAYSDFNKEKFLSILN